MARKTKILLIDDEKDFGFFLKKNLEKTGEFQVRTVTRAKRGVDLARKERPDLILLDIMMPEVSGVDVAEILLNDPRTNQIPLIFLTALVTREEAGVELAKKMKGRMFIPKTLGTKRVISSIKKILEKKQGLTAGRKSGSRRKRRAKPEVRYGSRWVKSFIGDTCIF